MKQKKIIIFGNTKFAEMIAYYITTETCRKVVGFTVDKSYISEPAIMDIEVIPFEDIDSLISKDEVEILPVIGYNKMNQIRRDIHQRIKDMGFQIGSFIHPSARIADNSTLGEGNIILENTLIQPFVTIGNGNVFWSNVNISHHTVIGDFNFFAPSSSLSGNVKVMDYCFFGNNSTVKNEARIGSYSLIGAGAYVSADTKEYSVLVPTRSKILEHKSSLDIHIP